MKITYFVHSITTDNEQGLATGWLQGSLSEEGIKRARQVGQSLDIEAYDAVFCSDLRRAIDSTELYFSDELPRYIDWRLRECNYGDFDGQPAADFKKDREQDYIETSYPGGESYREVEERIANFLTDVERMYPGGHIAIVAHQAPQLALDVLLTGKTWTQAIDEDWRKIGAWQPGWQYQL